MIVSEYWSHRLSIFDVRGQKILTFRSPGDSPDQIQNLRGIAIADADNIYVSSEHRLQKFTSSGELIKSVGTRFNINKKSNFSSCAGRNFKVCTKFFGIT